MEWISRSRPSGLRSGCAPAAGMAGVALRSGSGVDKNYREILKQLENEGVISARSTKGKRRAGTFADHVLIRFPEGGHIGH